GIRDFHVTGVQTCALPILKVIPVENILFGSEMVGAVRGVDPTTGFNYDDTKRYIDASALSAVDKARIFEGNACRVYPRLKARLEIGRASCRERGKVWGVAR